MLHGRTYSTNVKIVGYRPFDHHHHPKTTGLCERLNHTWQTCYPSMPTLIITIGTRFYRLWHLPTTLRGINSFLKLKTKTGKSEIVHIVAMKKIYPPVHQPEDHTAKSYDSIREEQPKSTKIQPSNEIQKRSFYQNRSQKMKYRHHQICD